MTRSAGFHLSLAIACLSVAASGCAGVRQSVKTVKPGESKSYDAKYDYADLRSMSDEIRDQVLQLPDIAKEKTPPIVVILGVENRTSVHMDTKALTDAIRGRLLRSGKMRFVNASRRDSLLQEQNYQARNARPETRAAIGKQLGAKYMLTGSMAEIKTQTGRQVRISKKEQRWYQLTVEITDLESGLIIGAPQVERVREASKPLIGW